MSLSSLSVPDRTSARRGPAMFLVLAFAFDFALTATMVVTRNLLWIYALMWSVALASVITRLVRREGFGDVSFRFGGRRSWRWVNGLIYGEHPVRVVAMIMFAVAATALGFVLARARLDTGSVWPETVAHSAWNSIIQAGFYPAVTDGAAAMWWVDMETGILMVAALIVGAVLVWRGDWVRRRTPDLPMVQEPVHA